MYTKTIAVGRLTKDPISRSYGQGNDGEMSVFTIAVSYGKDKTAFYDCLAFNKTAELINKYFKKGRPILVEGTFQNNNSEREVNGTKVTNFGMNLVVSSFSFVGDSNDGGNKNGGQQRQQSSNQQYGQQRQQPQQNQYQNNRPQQQQQPNQNPYGGFDGFDGGFSMPGDSIPF